MPGPGMSKSTFDAIWETGVSPIACPISKAQSWETPVTSSPSLPRYDTSSSRLDTKSPHVTPNWLSRFGKMAFHVRVSIDGGWRLASRSLQSTAWVLSMRFTFPTCPRVWTDPLRGPLPGQS